MYSLSSSTLHAFPHRNAKYSSTEAKVQHHASVSPTQPFQTPPHTLPISCTALRNNARPAMRSQAPQLATSALLVAFVSAVLVAPAGGVPGPEGRPGPHALAQGGPPAPEAASSLTPAPTGPVTRYARIVFMPCFNCYILNSAVGRRWRVPLACVLLPRCRTGHLNDFRVLAAASPSPSPTPSKSRTPSPSRSKASLSEWGCTGRGKCSLVLEL